MGFLSGAFDVLNVATFGLLDPLGVTGALTGDAPDLAGEEKRAFDAELLRLRAVRKTETETAEFLERRGGGLAREGEVEFGDEFDLENLSLDERKLRSSGRIKSTEAPTDTGLIL